MTRPSSGFHDLAEGLADGPLGGRVARVLGPRRVGQQAEDAFLAELGQGVEVGQLAVDRGVVELEVAGVDDDADRRAQGDAHGVGDGVADAEGGRLERAQLEDVAGLEGQDRVLGELVLLDLVAQQAAGQRRGVDRHARELRQDVRQAADVVLVRVRDEEGLDLLAALLEVGHVGHDEVDAEHLLVGEHQAAVDDHDLVAVLEDVHVLADLAHPTERDDAQDRVGRGRSGGRATGHGQKNLIWFGSSAATRAASGAMSVDAGSASSSGGRGSARLRSASSRERRIVGRRRGRRCRMAGSARRSG